MIRHLLIVLLIINHALADEKLPTSADPRLVVERFAAAPDIVHPIATDFDSKGRLLVVESHTHFRPAKYAGPKFDRIRVLEDTDGDGKADKFTTFFEGTTYTMDVAVHPDGSVYVATRNEILRLRDTKGTGTADEKTRIAFLDTTGNYPHNGLSGLTFDSRGDLYFGMGENLGADYKLIGADGVTLTGGGEGGNVFHCTADGKKLRRVATGFWNPFGSCRDIFGRLFVVDNDPDSSPPCRLVHVVEGGDYGFQFRYGRAGRHVFQAWNGELPGTLPYAAGTGESPCEVISYESDGLPQEYRGQLLVPVWADHRVERYIARANGASIVADRKVVVQGGNDFYPAGLSVAPDGSLFVTDWGSKSYELHGKGAVWHVRWKDAKSAKRPTEPRESLTSAHRPTREAAARALAKDEPGRAFLRDQLSSADVRVRAAALTALIDAEDHKIDLLAIAKADKEVGIREMAVRALVARGADVLAIAKDEKNPASVRAEAIAGITGEAAYNTLLSALVDRDPFMRHAAIQRLAQLPDLLKAAHGAARSDPKLRIGVLLAFRATGSKTAVGVVPTFLFDRDPDVRLLAAKWVADEKLTGYREQVIFALRESDLDPRTFLGLATALARIEDRPVDQDSMGAALLDRLKDREAPVASRIMILKSVPATHAKLKTEQLTEQLKLDVSDLRVEVLRVLKDRAESKAAPSVRELAYDPKQVVAVRAQALLTLAAMNQGDPDKLIELAADKDAALRQEALRALIQVKLSDGQKAKLAGVPDKELAARLLGKPFFSGRPAPTDTDAWLKRLEGPADADAGRRVFEHPRLANCAKCHRVDGRGADIGPDLSLVGRTDRRWIVESILQPSAVVAPNFQPWKVDTLDGRSRTGLLVRTYLDECTYIDAKGDPFKVTAAEVAEATPTRGSIMPDGLVDALTDLEIRDLVAYLASRK
ncbi:MAG TPA: PVC-type heme-binding CxxCH protein [Gemmataceae bacterium]|nr:PVC-type heme-binding CxxCH protein [Gemmataceae bacterium]